MEAVKQTKLALDAAYTQLVQALKDFLRAHGGFILTKNKDLPRIYGYEYNEEMEVNMEVVIVAIRLTEEDEILVFTEHESRHVDIKYDKESLLSSEAADEWSNLEGDYVDALPTVANIADLVEDYAQVQEG